MFDPLKFAVHIIHVLYSREAEAHSEVIRVRTRMDRMTEQNAFAREEMIRISKAERLFEQHRKLLDAELATYRGRINRLEAERNELSGLYVDGRRQ